jgi:hypothetical protein
MFHVRDNGTEHFDDIFKISKRTHGREEYDGATDESSGCLCGQRYLPHDRDTKFCPAFLDVLRSERLCRALGQFRVAPRYAVH